MNHLAVFGILVATSPTIATRSLLNPHRGLVSFFDFNSTHPFVYVLSELQLAYRTESIYLDAFLPPVAPAEQLKRSSIGHYADPYDCSFDDTDAGITL